MLPDDLDESKRMAKYWSLKAEIVTLFEGSIACSDLMSLLEVVQKYVDFISYIFILTKNMTFCKKSDKDVSIIFQSSLAS